MLFVIYLNFIVTGDSSCFVIYIIFWQMSYSTDPCNILNIILWMFPNLWYLPPVYDIRKINEMNTTQKKSGKESCENNSILPTNIQYLKIHVSNWICSYTSKWYTNRMKWRRGANWNQLQYEVWCPFNGFLIHRLLPVVGAIIHGRYGWVSNLCIACCEKMKPWVGRGVVCQYDIVCYVDFNIVITVPF
jgi:hypothetical protein